MSVRDHNLESIGEVFATFKVKQTAGSDDLTDADIPGLTTKRTIISCRPGT